MEWKVHNIGKEVLERLCAQIGNADAILLLDGSLGDVYPNAALIAGFKEHHKLASVVVVVDPKYQSFGLRFASPGVRYVYLADAWKVRAHLAKFSMPYTWGPCRLYPLLPTLHPLISEACLSRRISDPEVKRLILGLPIGFPFRWGKPIESEIHDLRSRVRELAPTAKPTLLICPLNFSNIRLPLRYLESITLIARDCGFHAFINCSEDREYLGSFDPLVSRIKIPACSLVEAAEGFSKVITVNSGVSYILSLQPNRADKLILYPQRNINGNLPNQELPLPSQAEELGPDFNNSKLTEYWWDDDHIAFQREIRSFLSS